MRDTSFWSRYVCRKLLLLLIASYVSFTMLLLLRILSRDDSDLEIARNPSHPVWSAGSHRDLVHHPSDTFFRQSSKHANSYSRGFLLQSLQGKGATTGNTVNETRWRFAEFLDSLLEPHPLEAPQYSDKHSGNFYYMHVDVFVYSAFYDDRKEETFIRLLTLSSQRSSRTFIYCHFEGDIFNVTRKGERYELCENHNRRFGGYIVSCQVPEFLDRPVTSHVVISWGQTGQKVAVPLLRLRPPAHKLKFLDSFVEEHTLNKPNTNTQKPEVHVRLKEDGNNDNDNNNIINNNNNNNPRLTFAICVPPLFGDISPYRVIEFIELSVLLGARHIFFYKYSISDEVYRVLSYYRDVVSLLPWLLPSSVSPDKVWYYGQLLAHNDCLYRAMPNYDLIAFNDIDEFIVPHQNDSDTWGQVFPELLTNRTCGWSFLSAFFDPGVNTMKDPGLLTPMLTARTSTYSKIRTKVMVCPWRVFEVGIHHVSKQNRETWTVQEVNTSTAFLHHYRHCVANYGMTCTHYVRDVTIERRYGDALRTRYGKAMADILK